MYKDDISAPLANRWEDKCVPYKKYFDEEHHTAKNGYENKSLISNICANDSAPNRFSFGVIEFDDHGTHWDREQLRLVKDEIKAISQAQAGKKDLIKKDPIKSKGILLVVFVHGWRHNASEGSSHLLRFRKLAQKIASSEHICNNVRSNVDGKDDSSSKPSPCESRPYVLAVYLSWRGDSLGLTKYTRDPTLKASQLLTFWDRKGAARRVAGTPMTETLLVLLDAIDTADRERRKEYKKNTGIFAKSKSLIIGHSFGARVVEHAVSQAFIAKRYESKRIFEDPDLGIAPMKSNLRAAKKRSKDLNIDMERSREDGKEKAKRINQIEQEIGLIESEMQEINRQLMSLPKSDEELNAYQEFEIDMMKSNSNSACRTYEPDDVVNCATREDSVSDFRQLAICAVRQVQCLHESHICSIEAALEKGGTDTSSSSWSCERRMLDLEIGTLGNEDGASADDIRLWREFLDDLTEHNRRIPSLEEVADMSDFELAKTILRSAADPEEAKPFYQTHFLLEQLRGLDIVPNTYFAPRLWPNDPTEGVEDELIDALRKAEQHVEDLVKQGTKDFKSMKIKLFDIQNKMAAKQKRREKLRQSKLGLDEERKELKRKMAELEGDIKKMKKERDGLEGKVKNLTEGIRYELDTFLRPPANLVLLLNPATEAMSAQNLIHAMCSVRGIGKNYAPEGGTVRPWVVSITSESDYATRLGFPFGVWLSRVFGLDADREYGEREPGEREPPDGGPSNDASKNCDRIFGKYEDLLHQTAGHLQGIRSHKIIASVRLERIKATGPYWIVRVPSEVMDGHDDFFNERIERMFFQLLKQSEAFSPICLRYDDEKNRCVNEQIKGNPPIEAP